jgi:hypothetical protein
VTCTVNLEIPPLRFFGGHLLMDLSTIIIANVYFVMIIISPFHGDECYRLRRNVTW